MTIQKKSLLRNTRARGRQARNDDKLLLYSNYYQLNETTMDLNQYKTRLEEEKTKLTKELESFARPNKTEKGDWEAVREDDPSGATSSDDVAEELENMNERKATEGPLEQQLTKVNLALKKIIEGKFGLCEVNGEPIEEDRLEADPTARTCKEHMNEEDNLLL
jgi:RNA polymerase-binding transcription factor DksA